MAPRLCGSQLTSPKTSSWVWQWGRGSLSRIASFLHRMVLCIATQDSHSLNHLSLRFGASLKSCRHLLENAKKSHVEVVGVRCVPWEQPPAWARLTTLSPGIICGHPGPLAGLVVLPPESVLSLEGRLIGISFCSSTVPRRSYPRRFFPGTWLRGSSARL